jgi:hypothetical protein
LAGALWIIEGEIRQLINILFCGYRRLEIGDCRSMMPKPILAWALVPQRVMKRPRWNENNEFLVELIIRFYASNYKKIILVVIRKLQYFIMKNKIFMAFIYRIKFMVLFIIHIALHNFNFVFAKQ